MTENNAAQPPLTNDQIEALAKKHIAPRADRLDAIMTNPVPYQQTEQFRRVKALIVDVLSNLRAPVADEPDWANRRTDSLVGWINEVGTLAQHPRIKDSWLRNAMRTIYDGLSRYGAVAIAPLAGAATGSDRQVLLEAIHRYGNARAMAEHNIAYRDEVRNTVDALVALFDAAPQASAAPAAFPKDGVRSGRSGPDGVFIPASQASADAFPPIDPVQAHVAHCHGCETCDGWHDMLGSQRQTSEAVRDVEDAERWRWATAIDENTQTLHSIVLCHGGDQQKINARADFYRAALSAQPSPQTEAPHDDQWTPEQLAAIKSQGPAEPCNISLVPFIYPVPDEIADPCPQCVSGAVCKKPTCGRLIAQTSGQADVTLPPTPRDVADAVRLIRSCDDEAAAQVALERFANGHARAAILAYRQQRARAANDLVQEFICATDALLASQERKTWTSGYKYELTAGERIRIAERWRQLRTTLAASTQCTEDGGSNG